MPNPTQALATLNPNSWTYNISRTPQPCCPGIKKPICRPAGAHPCRATGHAPDLAHAKFVSPEIEDLLLHHIDPTTGLANTEAIDDASKALLRETCATSAGQKNSHPISSIAWSANAPLPSKCGPRRAGAMTSCTFFQTCKRSSL